MSIDHINDLRTLGKAQGRLMNEINQIHESRQQMVEDSSQFFRPVTKQSEQAAQEVMKAVESIGRTVAAPEEVIVKNAIEKANDPVFGVVKRGENYVFGLVPLLEKFSPQIKLTYDMLSVNPDGVGIVGSNEHYEINKPLMHVLTRNAKPLNAKVKKVFSDLVDLSIGAVLMDLSKSPRNPILNEYLEHSVKFQSLIRKRYKFEDQLKSDDEDSFTTPTGSDTEQTDKIELTGDGYSTDTKRLAVLMGAAKAGNMQSGLREFTTILDKFWRDKQLTKKQYHLMLKRFTH